MSEIECKALEDIRKIKFEIYVIKNHIKELDKKLKFLEGLIKCNE